MGKGYNWTTETAYLTVVELDSRNYFSQLLFLSFGEPILSSSAPCVLIISTEDTSDESLG